MTFLSYLENTDNEIFTEFFSVIYVYPDYNTVISDIYHYALSRKINFQNLFSSVYELMKICLLLCNRNMISTLFYCEIKTICFSCGRSAAKYNAVHLYCLITFPGRLLWYILTMSTMM